MSKKRVAIPPNIREEVKKEFNYRCAICGADRPQIHHIDENPSNNDPLNLIPLCPNCHLIDHHNPTTPIEVEKIKLFRKFKDPTILTPQFHPLFKRMQFLGRALNMEFILFDFRKHQGELVSFINVLKMGKFFGPEIKKAIDQFYKHLIMDFELKKDELDYQQKLDENLDRIYELVIELLRYQPWGMSKNEAGK